MLRRVCSWPTAPSNRGSKIGILPHVYGKIGILPHVYGKIGILPHLYGKIGILPHDYRNLIGTPMLWSGEGRKPRL